MARQFNLIPPLVEQTEYHMFQREKVEIHLPELYHKIGMITFIGLNLSNYQLFCGYFPLTERKN